MPFAGAAAAKPLAKTIAQGTDDAARAIVDALTMYRTGGQKALGDFVDDEVGGVGLDLYKMQDQQGILREAQERTRASTPKSWLDPKFERGFHPASNTKLGDTNVTPKFNDKGTLGEARHLDWNTLLGKTLTPAYGDRTRAGGFLEGFDDVSFDPVEMHGGQAFMREGGTGVWASESGPMMAKEKTIRKLIESGEDPRLVYTAMGAQSGDFSKMMADAVAGQLGTASISKEAAAEFDARMVAQIGDAWPGINNIQAVHDLPGSTRWAVWQEMDRAKWRDKGFPDIGRTRLALTDPQLIDADPFDTGLAVSRPGGLLENPSVQHPTYSTQIDGEYLGDADMVPGPLVWRDFFNARRASGSSPASDQRSFMMNSPTITQKVDQQMIDEIGAFLEANKSSVQSAPSPSALLAAPGMNRLGPEVAQIGPLSNQRVSSVNDILSPAKQQAQDVIDLLKQGRADEVTDDMLAASDDMYLFGNYDLPMDEASRMARADETFPVDAYHSTRAKEQFPSFRGGSRGSTYLANSPDAATRGAAGQNLENPYSAPQGSSTNAIMPLRINPNDVKGLSLNQSAFDGLPDIIRTEDGLSAIADDVKKAGLEYWDDAYIQVPNRNGDGFTYYKNAPDVASYGDIDGRKDAFGYRLPGFNSGSDVSSLERAAAGGKKAFMVADEGGSSIVAHPDMPIRSRFARFDPRLKHLRNLSAGVGGMGLLGGLNQQDNEQSLRDYLTK